MASKTTFLHHDTFLFFPLLLYFYRAELSLFSTRLPTVSQLQQTLASVQELLVQQQQKIQELTQELAAAEVATISSLKMQPQHSSLEDQQRLLKPFLKLV